MERDSNPFDKAGMENFVADGNSCLDFKLVRKVEDLENPAGVFHPDMCHQIFGDGETIFGYENLKIKVYFTAGSLRSYIGIQHSKKIPASMIAQGVDADNIIESLEKVIQPGYYVNMDLFSACIEKEALSFKPFGELLHSFDKVLPSKTNPSKQNGNSTYSTLSNGQGMGASTFEIYACDMTVPKFSDYHKRMETFIMWYIDAASFIDPDDEKWKFFVMFEKYKTSDGQTSYAFVGYATVYNFYCYPENIRPRVAQMIILPPYQRQGLAVELLSTVYSHYRTMRNVVEITVEDPSDNFEVLRDFVDARDCMKLTSFSSKNLRSGYSEDMATEAKTVLKMTKRQSKRIYEMLRLRITNVEDEVEFKKFRLAVKSRLNIPYQKQQADLKRMIRRGNGKGDCVELQQTALVDDATRKTELESNFQNAYSHYKVILDRIEKHVTCSE